jgi:ectoine hydroxylase-related dioxygenase (phytanoyl-CoA dioxygenase family)
MKSGIDHAVPPLALLERMLTLRLHLDDCAADNSPLLIAPGSHRLGRIAERDIPATVERLGASACLAGAGDIWAYRTLVLHASARAAAPTRRRVLQLLYSADTLPPPLDWLGV